MPHSTFRQSLLRWLAFAQVWMSHLTISLTVGALTLQVVLRQVGWQVDWTEELARFSFLVMVFASASFASGKMSHLNVSVFSDFAARWKYSKWVVDKLQLFCILLFDGLFCWFASANVIEGLRYPTISPSLLFNENYLFLAPAAFFAIAILQRILLLFDEAPPVTTDAPA